MKIAIESSSLFLLYWISCIINTTGPYIKIENKDLKPATDSILVYYETPEAFLYFNFSDFINQLSNREKRDREFYKHIRSEYELISQEQDTIPLSMYVEHEWDRVFLAFSDCVTFPMIDNLIDSRRFALYDKIEKKYVDKIRIRYEYASMKDNNPHIYYEFSRQDTYVIFNTRISVVMY